MSEISVNFKPFNCYFCKKEIHNDSGERHMLVCGAVLEPCAQKCGAYVQRSLKEKHKKECVNNPRNATHMNNMTIYETLPMHQPPDPSILRRKNVVPQQNNYHRLSFDLGQKPHTSIDYAPLSNKISNMDQILGKLNQELKVLDMKHHDLLQINQNNLIITKTELEKLQTQVRSLFDWRKWLDSEMEKVIIGLQTLHQYKIELDNLSRDVKKYNSSFVELMEAQEMIKRKMNDDQSTIRNDMQMVREKLNEMHDDMVQENATIGGLWNDQNIKIELLQKGLSDVQKAIQEKESNYNKLVFDVRAVTQISSEASEKLEAQERKLDEMSKALRQFKLDFELLEDNQAKGMGTASVSGYLVWKIPDFSMKMENAKENNTILKSPLFYSHHYGYKIRVLFYLNGIKKWKGRYAIACIHVLNGEYDLTLKWPCNIEGTIALKDTETKNPAKDYLKAITAKRNSGDEEHDEPQESSTQYIFIPHTMLTKSNYLQDDTLFMEIIINNPFKSLNETNL